MRCHRQRLHGRRALALVVALAQLTTACVGGSDGDTVYTVVITPPPDTASPVTDTARDPDGPDPDGSGTSGTGSTPDTSVAPTLPGEWAVDVDACDDPGAARAPITGPLVIGSVAPQSGGLISVIYAPVVKGFQAYIDKANAEGLLGDIQLQVVVADDSGDPELTPLAVTGLLEAGVSVVSGVIGSTNNLAVRSLLNRACVPQLMALGNSPHLGEVSAAPWTMGAEVPVSVETTIYVNSIARTIGANSTVALIATDDDGGQSYASSFLAAAADTEVTVVEQENVPAASIDPPSNALLVIADKRPDVVVASLNGAACATFLTELADVRSAIGDWQPTVYMSGGCADPTILRLAGPAADGVLTSANLTADNGEFVDAMLARGVGSGLAAAAEGWTAAEVTVAILVAAQESSRGLTRESIIDAARHLSLVPSLARPGVRFTTNGGDDPYPAESLQIVRFDAATESLVDEGPLIAQFES